MDFYALNLAGGGADLACGKCVAEAKREHGASVVGVARTTLSAGEHCMWCGAE